MDSKISTSFIPKKSINADNLRSRPEPVGIVVLISVFILAVSVVYFAGIYTYRFLVYNEINSPCQDLGNGNRRCGLRESLNQSARDLPLAKIADLKRLDTKLKNGAAVLNGHLTLKPFFEQLGELTVQNIQYRKFSFDKDNRFELQGVAKSYEDIAYQQTIFASENGRKHITSFAFSDFDLDSQGNVVFKLILTVDSKLLSYRETLQ